MPRGTRGTRPSGRRSPGPLPPRRAGLRRILKRIYSAAIAAADPARAIREAVSIDGRTVHVGGRTLVLPKRARAHVLALGKAASAMAEPLVALGGLPLAGGVLVTKHGHARPVRGLDMRAGGHPLPDAASVRGAEAVLRYVRERVQPGDLVWVAISGGSSAVCCAPAPGLTLTDKRRTTAELLRAGAPIAEINTVRKHLSAIKGGRLAQACAGAHLWTLAVSDVMGDDLATIGSGPSAPDDTTFADAVAVLQRRGLWTGAPPRVRAYLTRGRAGKLIDTPARDTPGFRRHRWTVIANNDVALTAAADAARAAGFPPLVLSTTLGGETRETAALHAALAREVCTTGRPGTPPLALLSGGETVVTLGRSRGRGGRAQEFTLAFLDALGPAHRPVAVACVGTDGTDGPTDAAGAVGDDRTLRRAAALGLPAAAAPLAGHDAYPWFEALGDLVRTGPTGTNVMDVRIVLIA